MEVWSTVVSLNTVVTAAGLSIVGETARPGRDVTGIYLVDRADIEAPITSAPGPLRDRLLVLPPALTAPIAATSQEFIASLVASATTQRAAGIVLGGEAESWFIELCSRHGLPLLTQQLDPSAGAKGRGPTLDSLRALVATELRRQFTTSSLAPAADGVDHLARLLRLLDEGARSVGAELHLDIPGALVNPFVTLSPAFRSAALDCPVMAVKDLPYEGRVARVDVGRPGCSLLFTRSVPTAWPHRPVAAVVAACRELVAEAAVSRGTRSMMEHTFMRELITGDSSAVGPWAETLGLPPGCRVTALVINVEDVDSAGCTAVESAVHDAALASLKPAVAATREGRVLALIPRTGSVRDAVLDSALDSLGVRLAPILARPVAIGTSSCVLTAPDDLVHALVSAGQMLDRELYRAETETARTSDTRGLPARMKVPLVAGLLSEEASSTLSDVVLAPLLRNDGRSGSSYVETLRTYLLLDCRMAETAEVLGVHTNTLRYRLQRIEALTGRDLHVTADRVDFYLALTLRDIPHQGSAGVGGNSAMMR
ncbi:PucR family transcriptional regulator [Corynebacterium glyciniphilum]|uniref:PucR family transcriptional regulator n=1 Tax=Corynebacterium glyciniphilum TaxID=1404244 RepID=UPI003FD5CF73